MKRSTFLLVLTGGCLLQSSALCAKDELFYYKIPLRQLALEGALPTQSEPSGLNWQQRQMLGYFLPYAIVEQGQVYVDFGKEIVQQDFFRAESVSQILDNAQVIIETPQKSLPSGTLIIPRPDLSGMDRFPFKLKTGTAPLSAAEGSTTFYAAMQRHYELLLQQDFTGGAWFRYQALKAAGQSSKQTSLFDPNTFQTQDNIHRPDPFESSYALFTGQQAISENIQLDRTLQTFANQPRTIDLSTIEGITTAQIDWQALVKDVKVDPDPLAAYIPADQHAIFYPTFRSMMDFLDRLKDSHQTLEPVGFSVAQLEFYEQQMCVWLDGWSRFWGPKSIRGVALTGSDPYLAEGTDSAILFDARVGKLVYGNTESKQKDKLKEIKGAKLLEGSIDDVHYRAVISPDRRVCSYLAQVDNVVVVTNSLAQLQKIVRTAKNKQPRMADLDEYKFFRNRYNEKQNEQTALVVLTDAAIRRWCSPQWRIGAARRRFAIAALAHMQAAWLEQGSAFDIFEAQKFLQNYVPDIDGVTLTEAGVTSIVYGNLKFMTPIAELPINKISAEEKQQYERFRDMYQRQWSNFFDPIAVCFLHDSDCTNFDLTVRPLIAASEYRQWMQFGGNNTIRSGDGDPHAESIAHLVFAVDKDSEPIRQAGQFANTMMPLEGQMNAFSWLGRWITLYADESPFWQELSVYIDNRDSRISNFLEANTGRIPLAVAAEIESPARLAVFLVSLRAFIQQTAPNMTAWETLAYKDQAYVKITVRYNPESAQPPALYYAVLPDQLVFSPNESLIQRAIDRSLDADNKKRSGRINWAGNNIALRVNEQGWKIVELLANQSYAKWLQMQAWNNLPILTEWHALKGNNESQFHESFWYQPLSNPSGTEYKWNENWRTVESTLFGHPGQPKLPSGLQTPLTHIQQADLGITFEEDGLRSIIKVQRQKK